GGVITDLEHLLAHDRSNRRVRLGGHFAGHDHEAGGQQGLDCDPAGRVVLQEVVEHAVADLVSHLVRVTFGHGLRREKSSCHGVTLSQGGIGLTRLEADQHARHPSHITNRRTTWSQMACATTFFELRSTSRTLPSAPRMTTSLSAEPNTAPPLTSLTTRKSQPLRASLARPSSITEPVLSPVSAANPTTTCPSRARWWATSARMSGFCSSSIGAADPSAAFLILDSLSEVGRKSAGAAAMTTASARAAAATTASRISAVVSTLTTSTPAGSGRVTLAATRVTCAPRATAARANA